MVTIIDYGMGNLGSIQNILKKIGYSSIISKDPSEIANADRLILPGVGKFDKAMSNLAELGFIELIRQKADDGIPLLGICLGMQLLATDSEEGTLRGLGLIPGHVRKFTLDAGLKVPHMGWNLIDYKAECPIFAGFEHLEETRFYFVHSYHYCCDWEAHSVSTTYYGLPFTSSIWKSNIYGVQYHPEKSHKFGMKLLSNFMEIVC